MQMRPPAAIYPLQNIFMLMSTEIVSNNVEFPPRVGAIQLLKKIYMVGAIHAYFVNATLNIPFA
jgi:hypothetical protein